MPGKSGRYRELHSFAAAGAAGEHSDVMMRDAPAERSKAVLSSKMTGTCARFWRTRWRARGAWSSRPLMERRLCVDSTPETSLSRASSCSTGRCPRSGGDPGVQLMGGQQFLERLELRPDAADSRSS
jgi:hypothetical protein